MKTIFITGHDTGIGKTWITRYIARKLSEQKENVQIVKVVETGVRGEEESDVTKVLKDVDLRYANGFTLNSFATPLAPISAAKLEGRTLELNQIKNQIQGLPKTSWRLLEAAGGIAVPIDVYGKDGRDLALELAVDYIVVVIENRLGAINQGRLVLGYLDRFYKLNNIGLWFNDLAPRDKQLTDSNFKELSILNYAIWGHHGFKEVEAEFCNAPFLSLEKIQ